MTSFARVVLLIAVTLTVAGCSAAPTVKSEAIDAAPAPSAVAAPDWVPDVTIVREFDGADGTKTCTILSHVPEPSTTVSTELAEAMTATKEFLAAGDWTSVEVSLDEFETDDLEARRAQGVSDPELLTMLVLDRINSDLTRAGLLVPGVSLETHVACV